MMRNLWPVSFLLLLFCCGGWPASAAELIAVAADTNDASSLVSRDPVHSVYYLIFADTGELLEVLDNPYQGGPRGSGVGAADFLARHKVTVIVAQGFSPAVIRVMMAHGIRPVAFRGVARDAVDRINIPDPERKPIRKGDN